MRANITRPLTTCTQSSTSSTHEIARAIGRHTPFVHVPPAAALTAAAAIGRLVGDVVVTKDELEGLMAGLEPCAQGFRGDPELLGEFRPVS
jgi:hypothetical protein